jgi:N-glycosylase/DNA lyase
VLTVLRRTFEYNLTKPLPVSRPPRLDFKWLQNFRKKHLKPVQSRIKEFRAIGSASEERIFCELCYCILTPQSSGLACDRIVFELVKKGVLQDPESRRLELEDSLKKTRFWRNKSRYILRAWERFVADGREGGINELLAQENRFNNPLEFRNWLRGEFKGLGIGMKEASHFLRNIGRYSGIAIVDRHVLSCLSELSLFNGQGKNPRSERDYLKREKQMIDFSVTSRIPLEELDLLLWSARTGYIFK